MDYGTRQDLDYRPEWLASQETLRAANRAAREGAAQRRARVDRTAADAHDDRLRAAAGIARRSVTVGNAQPVVRVRRPLVKATATKADRAVRRGARVPAEPAHTGHLQGRDDTHSRWGRESRTLAWYAVDVRGTGDDGESVRSVITVQAYSREDAMHVAIYRQGRR